MDETSALSIRSRLARLKSLPGATAVFGALGHGFDLNPRLGAADLAAFERRHSIELPADYRWFLTAVANGGAGPYYGVFPLGHFDGLGDDIIPWTEADGFVGVLSRPFPQNEAWNDLDGLPDEALVEQDEEAYERLLEKFELRYWSSERVDGAVPICAIGCALRIWLVVTGAERGNLWRDLRADAGGLLPMAGRERRRISFLEWYEDWIEEALEVAVRSPPRERLPAPAREWSLWSWLFRRRT